ncbi:MAG TPA: type II secretion system protein GspC, partial [Myxococcota bacterium]
MRHVLENFIRRRFFVVNLVLLAVAAVLAARTVTAVAGHVVADKIKEKTGLDKPVVAHAPPPKPSATRDFNQASDENIFLGKREVVQQGLTPVAVDQPKTGTSCDDAGKSALRLRLVGTVVFSTTTSSLASIVDEGKSGSLAEMYSVNDCADVAVDATDPNAKLAAKPAPCSRVGESAVLKTIEPERVCLWNDSEHRMEYLAISDEKLPVAPKPVATNTDPPPDTDLNIKKTGENSYEVAQDEVNKALNNLAELSTQARVVPAFEGGKTVGFKLFSIRPGSLYSKIGLQNGDVVTAINGYEMTDPAKGLEIYTKLKDAKAVNVDMKRRGKAMTLNYNITP